MSITRMDSIELQRLYSEAHAAWSSLRPPLKKLLSEPPCPLRSGSKRLKRSYYAFVVNNAARFSSLSDEQVEALVHLKQGTFGVT